MMALSHFLRSACTIVLGNQNNTSKMQNDEKIQFRFKENKSQPESMRILEYQLMNQPGFQMPLHYPRYKKGDYKKMEEWQLDILLMQYGLRFNGTLEEKRAYAIGAFLWPDQL
ncbi:hypothetical protein LIER_41246 [Lithospermum erythrorhizon]|uniref:DUF7722 domain-containing protein n=1 Tax=Lithospermum erythrorhizon TaxID=34254 RepID=A0AAV3R9P9_LITER